MLRRALIALTLSSSQVAGADCAMVGLTPKVLTPANTTVTGGVVVGSVGLDGGKLEKGDVAVQKDWKLTKGKPTIKTIAPGLALYRSAKVEDELFDAAGKSLLKFKVGDAKPFGPPAVTKATHSGKSGGYHTPERVKLELAYPPPADVVAVILTDAKGTAKSWWQVDPASKDVYAFYQSDCTPLPNGTQMSKPGDTIKIQYVHAGGELSALSVAITIK
jgi:hypothetical protein